MGLKVNSVADVEHGFFEMVMDSLMAVQFRTRLENLFGLQLPATLAFDYPNIQYLSAFLWSELSLPQELDQKFMMATDKDQLSSAIEFELSALEYLLRDEA